MTPEAIDGLWIVLIVTTFTIVYCPLLSWLLEDKTSTI